MKKTTNRENTKWNKFKGKKNKISTEKKNANKSHPEKCKGNKKNKKNEKNKQT